MKKNIFAGNLFALFTVLFFVSVMQGCQQNNVASGNQFVKTKSTIEYASKTPTSENTIGKTDENFSGNTKMNNTESIKTDNSNLITNKQIGKIHLDMTMKDIKRFYPKASFKIVSGTLDNVSSDILVTENGEKLFYFTTENFSEVETEELPEETDKIDFLMTDNPRFATGKGIKVGQTFGDAEKAYGKPKFFADSFFDFVTFNDVSVNKMTFYFVHKKANDSNRAYSLEQRITHIGTGK